MASESASHSRDEKSDAKRTVQRAHNTRRNLVAAKAQPKCVQNGFFVCDATKDLSVREVLKRRVAAAAATDVGGRDGGQCGSVVPPLHAT